MSRDDLYTTWHDETRHDQDISYKMFALMSWNEASRQAGSTQPAPGFQAWFLRHGQERMTQFDLGASAWQEAWRRIAGPEQEGDPRQASSAAGLLVQAREKLSTRRMIWKEIYTPKTKALKEQYEAVIGEGSYYRFEGQDADSDDRYLVIVAPGKVHKPLAKWYAGIHKLPSDYATAGLYFQSIKKALEYAFRTWGVPIPKSVGKYDTSHLKGISKKLDEWKEKHQDPSEESQEEDDSDKKEASRRGLSVTAVAGEIWAPQGPSGAYGDYILATFVHQDPARTTTHVKNRASGKTLCGLSGIQPTYGGHNSVTCRICAEKWKALKSENPSFASSSAFMSKEALAERLKNRQGFVWFDVNDDFIAGNNADFNRMAVSEPDLLKARQEAIAERVKRKQSISRFYGREYVNHDFYQIWIAHKPDEGTYLVAVGPYCNEYFRRAQDKFGVFTRKLNVASQEDIDAKVASLIQEYADRYGVTLDAETDINVPSLEEKPYHGEITITGSGRQKIYNTPEWQQQIADYYRTGTNGLPVLGADGRPVLDANGQPVLQRTVDGVTYEIPRGRGESTALRDAFKDQTRRRKAKLDAAYAESQANGEAFKHRQPPPPRVDLEKQPYGQQIMTSIYKVNRDEMEGLSQEEKIERFGFDSIHEAFDRLQAVSLPGAPIRQIPNVTSDQLQQARARRSREIDTGDTEEIQVPGQELVRRPTRTAPASPADADVQTEETDVVQAPAKVEKKEPVEKKPAPVSIDVPDMGDIGAGGGIGVFGSARTALRRMIALAEDMDAKGRHDDAEEIQAILRKYIRV